MRDGKAHPPELERTTATISIVCQYQAEYRGYVQYYALAQNIALAEQAPLGHAGVAAENVGQQAPDHGHEAGSSVAQRAGPRTDHGACLEVAVPRDGKAPLVADFGGLPPPDER